MNKSLLSQVNIREECFLPYGKGWLTPTPEEVRQLIALTNLTGSQIAKVTGVIDSRQVRRWCGGDAKISFAVWAIIAELAGFGLIWKNFSG